MSNTELYYLLFDEGISQSCSQLSRASCDTSGFNISNTKRYIAIMLVTGKKLVEDGGKQSTLSRKK